MPGLLAILVALALAPSSFAQVSITLTPTPSPNEINTNHSAQTSDPSTLGAGILITGALLANSPLTTTVLAIAYPTTITSSPALCDTSLSTSSVSNNANQPTAGDAGAVSPNNTLIAACSSALIPSEDPIAVSGATGVFQNISGLRLNTNLKRIEIDLPGFPTTAVNMTSGSFRITGVRLDMNGITAPVVATATLGSAANNYLLSTTSATVINGAGAGIASLAIGARTGQTNQGTAAIFTNRTVPKGTASLLITGGFAGAFRTRSQLSNSGIAFANSNENSTRVQLTFTGIPTGVTLNLTVNGSTSLFCAAANCNGSTLVGTSGTTTVTSTANVATLEIQDAPSLGSTPTIEVDVTSISLTSTAAVTTPAAITVSATMAPVCTTNVDASGSPIITNGYPCFTEADVGPVTIANILPTSTTMLMPYAITSPPFDTGLAVANTTADPFGSTGGGATATSGTMKFDFFPTSATGGAGTPFSLTTSSTNRPGAGLSSDGTLASGATYTVLLSQLLTAAGQTGNFTGYLFITTSFLNGHGTATISDFRTYSLTANVLVMPPPATASRATPSSGAELLHY